MGKAKSTKKGTTWKKEVKSDDVFLSDPKSTDIVIPIMGPAGSGKSSFINALIGQPLASVGHDLESHTMQIQHFTFFHPDFPNRRIVVIDTPGFDSTNVDDREILRRIAMWLARSYDADMKLAGIIYLHEITQTRMVGTARKNLDIFNRLCGKEAVKNVILATTKWSEVKKGVGEQREFQLKNEHWRSMVDLGSKVIRFNGTQRSARRIVNYMLTKGTLDAVQIQRELVEIGDILAETEAGRTLRFTLQELLHMQKTMVGRLRQQGDPELQGEVAVNEEKIRVTLEQIKALNVPLSRRIMRFLGVSVSLINFLFGELVRRNLTTVAFQ